MRDSAPFVFLALSTLCCLTVFVWVACVYTVFVIATRVNAPRWAVLIAKHGAGAEVVSQPDSTE